MLLWVLSGVSLVVAAAAWMRARRAVKRLEELSQLYWQLRYEAGELRVEVERLSSRTPREAVRAAASEPAELPAGRPAEAFVPLTSLKR